MPQISIIIPTLNEERSIRKVIGELPCQLRSRCEIVVVDGNSTDRTREIAKAAGARVVVEKRPGYGRALLSGAENARGSVLVLIDGDGTYSLAELPSLIKPIEKGEADMAVGSRFDGRIERGAMPALNYFGNRFFTFVTNLLFGTSFSDTHSGFRVIRSASMRKLGLKCGGMDYATEMMVRAAEKKVTVAYLPITYRKRAGHSKLNPFTDGARHLWLILKMFLSRR